MGKGSAPTIGYHHSMTLYVGHMHGPADALHAIEWGGEMAWQGNQTASGDISINRPNLFGGEKKEGGIVGTWSVRMGEPDQMPHPKLQALRPGPWPAGRGLVTSVYDGIVGALSPYVKTFRTLWSRYYMGWGMPVWQPDLSKVGEGMNPAHILYQAVCSPTIGMGLPAGEHIDEATLLKAATTLHAEGFGLCLWWVRSQPTGEFLDLLCEHIGGLWCINDDKVELRLFRADYDVATLPLLDEDSIIELVEWDQPQIDGSINEVTVVGKDCLTNKDISRTYQNLANIQAQGRVVPLKKELPGLWSTDLVARVAARECLAISLMPFRVKVKVKGAAGPFKRGEIRALSWSSKGVSRAAVRVMEVDEGTAIDSTCTLTLLQDINGMVQTTYVAPDGSGWTPPDTAPVPLDPQAVYEATYRDLAGAMRPADLQLLAPESGYLVAVAARPVGVAYNFLLYTQAAGVAYRETGSGDFVPQGLLVDPLPRGDAPVDVLLANHRDLALVEPGEEVIIGTEHARVIAIDALAGRVTVARACVDTTPAPHAAGELVWFPDVYHGFDPTEYLDGETVNAKLLTRTPTDVLPLAAATALPLLLDGRQGRPYPPGRLRISDTFGTTDAAWPLEAYGALTATWVHRDRLLQADQLVESAQPGIGPEPGTTYTARWYLDGVLDRTQAGITGTSDSYTPPAGSGGKTVRVEIESLRDGLPSWQRLQHTFLYIARRVTTTGAHRITTAGDARVLR